jgi:hypothetical protein
MPEQLSKHPEVTLSVLKSAGAKCGEAITPKILTTCPEARFCQVPGGEICVYGLAEASKMTQITRDDWRDVLTRVLGDTSYLSGSTVVLSGLTLMAGIGVGLAVARFKRRADKV